MSLYAYSGTAHIVVPMCSDYRLITHHLESLSPGIMPVQGSNLKLLMEMADSALLKVEAPSTLLLVSDVMEENHVDMLLDFVDNSIHSIEILAMATQQGARIPKNAQKQAVTDAKGNAVISSLDPEVLFQLQKHRKGNKKKRGRVLKTKDNEHLGDILVDYSNVNS